MPDHQALKTVLAFPNTYKIGITSLGFQIIWATLAQRKDVDVRRLFTDQGENQHSHSDLFGFSLSWELDGPTILNMLDQSNIPFWNHERTNNDPLVFGGGPVLTANPEPFAPFFDVILLGDGEALLPKFIDTVIQHRDLPKARKLQALAQIPGIYIPSLYLPQYSKKGELESINPINNDIPHQISKQTWSSNTLSHSSVITPEAAWPNIHMVEVVRSCPELCRFCLASYLTLPFRSSSLDDGLIPAVEKGLNVTKRIGLLGASVTQHPQFNDLLDWLNQDQLDDIRLSVSSVRASTVTKKMTTILSKLSCKSMTIAIESGSERMRQVVNKKLGEEEIFAAAKYAQEGGLTGLKLYGIVGLPSEGEDDIEATAELLLRLKRNTKSLRLTLGVSTFVPKAHTPFQWQRVHPEGKKRLRQLEKKLKPKGIEVRAESFNSSIIQALIARSDRRLAPVIAAIRANNPNSVGNWKQAYKAIREENLSNLPSWDEVIYSCWSTSKILPWSHINGPLKKEKLAQHQDQSLSSQGI